MKGFRLFVDSRTGPNLDIGRPAAAASALMNIAVVVGANTYKYVKLIVIVNDSMTVSWILQILSYTIGF